MTDPRTLAEKLIRKQSGTCESRPDSCDIRALKPLCSVCQEWADAIEDALHAAAATERTRREQVERELAHAKEWLQKYRELVQKYRDLKERADAAEARGKAEMEALARGCGEQADHWVEMYRDMKERAVAAEARAEANKRELAEAQRSLHAADLRFHQEHESRKGAQELLAAADARGRQICPECNGIGNVLDAPANVLDGRTHWALCDTCGGTGHEF